MGGGEIQNTMDTMDNSNKDRNDTRESFRNSSMDDKLLMLFDEMRFMRDEQVRCSTGMLNCDKAISQISEKVNKVIHVTNTQSDLLKTLAYKSIDSEARFRRNNLIFRGFVEIRGENCFATIRQLLSEHLGLDPSTIYIARAHRLGVPSRDRHHQRRPIIVNFRDFGDTEMIMHNAKKLKNTPYSVDYDLPKEIQTARKMLWPVYKQCRSENPRANVKLVYPARLLVDGRLVQDELPEWNRYVHANRLPDIANVPHIHVSNSHNRNDTDMQRRPRSDSVIVNTTNTPTEVQVIDSQSDHHASGTTVEIELSQQSSETPANSSTLEINSANTSTQNNHTVESILSAGENVQHDRCTDSQVSQVLRPATFQSVNTNSHSYPSHTSTSSKENGKAQSVRATARSERRSTSSAPYGRQQSKSVSRTFRRGPTAVTPSQNTDNLENQECDVTIGVDTTTPINSTEASNV